MKKEWLFLIAFMCIALLLVAVAIIRGYLPAETGGVAVIIAFALGAGFFYSWISKRKLERRTQGSDKKSNALIWLLLAVAIPGVGGIIQALHEKWDSGNTIGLTFFMLFATSCIYEILRRRRTNDTK
ncbi:MAG TPA: hypothetical protein VFK06_07125 [Candidatus Angelobacter sp.]|nr:hypothetical protein [Candidatus Angelobacter sp.]